MIGQVTIGKSFGGVVRYVLEKDQAEILDEWGVRSSNAILVTQDFNAIRMQKPNLKNAVWHTSISFAYDDSLSKEKLISIGKDYLEKIGLDEHQYLMVRHHDTKHEHIHIISNRVGFEGELASDKWCKNRTAQICDLLEEKYQLTVARDQGKNNTIINDRIPLKKQIKNQIKEAIAGSLSHGISDFDHLTDELKTHGIELLFHIQKTGRVNGISFRCKGVTFKGSAIDKSFSYGRLAKGFEGGIIHESFSFQRLAKGLSQNRNHDKDQDHDQRRKN